MSYRILNAVTGAEIVSPECLRRQALAAKLDDFVMAQTICRAARKHTVAARLVIERV